MVLVILVLVLVISVVLVLVLVMPVLTVFPVRCLRPSLLRLLPLTLDRGAVVLITLMERLPPVLTPPRLVPLIVLDLTRTCIRNDDDRVGKVCFFHDICELLLLSRALYIDTDILRCLCVECAHLFMEGISSYYGTFFLLL